MNKPKYNKSKTKSDNKRPKSKSRDTIYGNDCNSKPTDNVHISGNINDPSYYFSNELLKVQLGTISFNDFTGVPIALSDDVLDDIPYAMRIYLNPSAGFTSAQDSTAKGSAINLAALQTYTTLTASNAKTSSYGPQDITSLFLAVGSMISLISYAKRGFGSVFNYSLRNRAYPEKITTAMGIAYDDLVANLANYRVRFNAAMNQISKVPIPGNIAYFKKCDELYSGIYMDMMGSPMAQTYLLVPESVWLLDETGSEEGTVLRTIPICDSDDAGVLSSMDFILAQIERQIKALTESATFNKIYADILRLNQSGAMPLWQFELLPDNYVVLPTYNAEIRKWINNLTIMGKPMETPFDGTMTQSNNVYPDADTNKVVYRPQFQNPAPCHGYDRILNFDFGTYTVDDIIMATRLMTGATVEYDADSATYYTTAVALPDHYVTAISIFTVSESVKNIKTPQFTPTYTDGFIALSDFDWHPIFPIYNLSTNALVGIFGDLNYYTTVDFTYLKALQDATYFGLFEVR